MLIIAYDPVGFPEDSGPALTSPGHLCCSWSDLVWAAVTLGRKTLGHSVWPLASAYPELIQRSTMLYENLEASDFRPGLWEAADAHVLLSPLYKTLEYVDKPRTSSFLRLAVARLFAAEYLDLSWLSHRDSYAQGQQVSLPPDQYPELLGLNRQLKWMTIETKGRSNRLDRRAVGQAALKAAAVRSVAGHPPARCLGFSSYFSGKDSRLKAYVADSRPNDKRAGLELTLSASAFVLNYYRLIVSFITSDYGSSPKSERYGNREFLIKRIAEADMQVGLLAQIVDPAQSRSVLPPDSLLDVLAGLELPSDRPERTTIGRDGVLVQLGHSWSDERMSLPPGKRADPE